MTTLLYASPDGYTVTYYGPTSGTSAVVACPQEGHHSCGYVFIGDAPDPVTDEYKATVSSRIRTALEELRVAGCALVIAPEPTVSPLVETAKTLTDEERAALVAEAIAAENETPTPEPTPEP